MWKGARVGRRVGRTAPTWLARFTRARGSRSRQGALRGLRPPFSSLQRMVALLGDSARGGDWAAVRLRVDRGRIVDADAAGIEHDLRGLTLLEAASVGGETLPVDALANAIGPAITAPGDERRVAVAMSGGVDSAGPPLKAGPRPVRV